MIRNYTPQDINMIDGATFASQGVARVSTETVNYTMIDNVQIVKVTFGQVQGLPEPSEGDFFIVSQIVKSALPNRSDLLVPAELVRDNEGRIIGCKSLAI